MALGVGVASPALDAVASAFPPSCHEVPGESIDGFRVFDCAGSDHLSPNREIWAIADLGDVRAVGVIRVRHSSSGVVVSAAASRLRSLRRSSPGAAVLDLARWGAVAVPDGWPFAFVDHEGDLVVSDQISPRRTARVMRFARTADVSVCETVRAQPPGRTTRVVLDDRALDGGGCDIAAYVGSGERGFLLIVRAQPSAEGAVLAQHYAPAADEASARAALAAARADLDAAMGTPRPPPAARRRR